MPAKPKLKPNQRMAANVPADSSPLTRRQSTPKPTTQAFRRSAQNLLLGLGVDTILDVLDHSNHPKAHPLSERLRDGSSTLSFGTHLKEVGIGVDDFLQIFGGRKSSTPMPT